MRVAYMYVSQELLHMYFLEAALFSQSRRMSINASNQAITATISPWFSKK